MEAVALPGAGEMHARAGAGVERRDLRLGGDGVEREERVFRRDRHDHLRRIDLLGMIDRHHEVALVREPLQGVHPVVGRRHQRAGLGPGAVVPGRARLGRAGQGRHVRVHDGVVLIVGEGAEQAAFLGVGVGEQAERRVGVRGHDHAVEAFFTGGGRHDDLRAVAADAGHALAETEVGGVRLEQRLDIGPGAAFEGQPLVLRIESEEAVVMEEAHQRRGREAQHLLRRRGPDRGRHRDEVEIEEILAEPFARAPVAQRGRLGLGGLPFGLGQLVELVDLQEQLPEAQAEEVAALREEVVERATAPLQAGRVVADREGHRRLLGLYAQLLEQTAEVRVRHLVEDHEARVHRQGAARAGFGDVDRVGVAAGATVPVEDRHVVVRGQEAKAAEAAHAGADDRDAFTHAAKRPRPSCARPLRRPSPARL